MSREIETILCEVCDSQYKIVYDLNETSGYSKFCPFCGEVTKEDNENEDEEKDDE